MYDLHVNLL